MASIRSTDIKVSDSIWMSLSSKYGKRYNAKAPRVLAVVKKALPLLRTKLSFSDDVVVRVAPIKQKNTSGRYWSGSKMVELDCRLTARQAMEFLCHELVHAEQYYTGKLTDRGHKQARWMGELYNCTSATTSYKAYREQPWEMEAFGRQKELATWCWEKLAEEQMPE